MGVPLGGFAPAKKKNIHIRAGEQLLTSEAAQG